jgi:hypothetical protein
MTATHALDETRARYRWAYLTVALLALLSSFNALANGFTYDDRFIVAGNEAVRSIQGWQQFLLMPYWPLELGGDGYRPLTIFLFAAQWAVTSAPILFHAVSLTLYALTAVCVLWCCSLWLDRQGAWLAAALFAVHPVHAEVTGGVVGQAELVVAICILVAVRTYIAARRRGDLSRRDTVAIATLYMIGCLAKEHAAMLPAILVACEVILLDDGRPWTIRIAASRSVFLALGGTLALYLVFRAFVIGHGASGFSPYTPFVTLHIDATGRALTMLGMIPHWLRLLTWPATMSTEYGPPSYPLAPAFTGSQAVGALILAGVAWGFVWSWKNDRRVCFSLAWIVITLLPVTNVLMPTGILIAERTLFLPSLGVVALAALGIRGIGLRFGNRSLGRVGMLVVPGALLILGASRSITRVADWRSNESLFTAAVRDEPQVYRSHYMLGAWYLETGRWNDGERELRTAMALFGGDPAVAYNLGIVDFMNRRFAQATRMFQVVDSLMPGALSAKTKIALSLALQGKFDEAQTIALQALQESPADSATARALVQAADLEARIRARQSAR